MGNRTLLMIAGLLFISVSCGGDQPVEKSETEVKKGVIFYKGKEFTGTMVEKFDDLTMKSEWQVKDGLAHGTSKNYYPNGQINEAIEWKKGLRDGTYEKFFDNGGKEIKGTFTQGKKDGYFETFYISGELFRKGVYENGMLQGVVEEYFENGNMRKSSN